jgi:hypothetical protein
MSRRLRLRLGVGLLAAAWGVCGHADAEAQTASASAVEAVPVQGLAFGPLLPGVPEAVSVRDGARRAEVVLDGQGTVDVSFLLPRAMVSASGARIPLHFGALDGAVVRHASSGLIPLNPLETSRLRLQSGQGAARLLLGGTALPAPDQPAGRYATTVVLVLSNPGT